MTATEIASTIIDRLRSNLRNAGIDVPEAEIDAMVEMGLLRNAVAFAALDREVPRDVLPDWLAAWGPDPDADAEAPARPSGRSGGTGHQAQNGYPSLVEVAERVRSREVSPIELTQQALDRIAERDAVLNAFQCVLADEALQAARTAEAEIRSGEYRGPLHGIPVAVKDLFAMRGTVTSAGSRILAGAPTDYDAAVVERLRQAGALIVGKTRMPEFAYSPGSNNPIYGPTRNPWNLEHDTGGSSSGSGAAVADGLVFAALGSDTGGSIRIPAALCGVVGLKPTFGRISLYGAVPLAWSLDHPGPLTRTVADATILLQALAGHDPRDLRTRPALYPAVDLERGVNGLRVGVLRDDGSGVALGNEDALAAWKAGLAALERNGARLVEVDLPEMRDLRVATGAIMALEALAYHAAWVQGRFAEYGGFAGPRLLAGYAYAPDALVRAQQLRGLMRQRFDTIFEHVDLLSTPAMPYGAPPLGTPAPTVFTNPFNGLGWPAVSVPVGLTADRLPLGLQLAGRPWDEATVLQAAQVVETEGPWPGGRPWGPPH